MKASPNLKVVVKTIGTMCIPIYKNFNTAFQVGSMLIFTELARFRVQPLKVNLHAKF